MSDEKVREEKYRYLEKLLSTCCLEFLISVGEIDPSPLDCEMLIKFLKHKNLNIQKGARLLLGEYFPEQLYHQMLLDSLENKNPNIRSFAYAQLKRAT